jgi:hypothetical protein
MGSTVNRSSDAGKRCDRGVTNALVGFPGVQAWKRSADLVVRDQQPAIRGAAGGCHLPRSSRSRCLSCSRGSGTDARRTTSASVHPPLLRPGEMRPTGCACSSADGYRLVFLARERSSVAARSSTALARGAITP